MDGQSYLLLIRDEGGPPELQVSPPHVSLLLALFLRELPGSIKASIKVLKVG